MAWESMNTGTTSSKFPLHLLFEEGQTGFSWRKSVFGDEYERFAVLFARDADGVVTGMMYKLD